MLRGIQIVVADDDLMSLEMLCTTLAGIGCQCTAVTNGSQALEALQLNPDVSIVLLDIQMPVMDGYEVLLTCREQPNLRDIPIIVLSADRNEKVKSLSLGADDFLAKPYDLEELELRITKLIQWRRLTQSSKLAKNEFIAIASHELRTPLHQIVGLTELIDITTLDQEHREIISMLKQATGSMTGIISEILKYAELDSGLARAPAAFSLRDTLTRAIKSAKESTKRRDFRFELNFEGEVPDALSGSSSSVYTIFSILLSNAVKFSSAGEIRIAISWEAVDGGSSCLHCRVSDQGIGIPENFHEAIFDPFVQVESSRTRTRNGLGLGLAIAKRLVEQMGGSIAVKSDSGMGSSFEFSFECHLQA